MRNNEIVNNIILKILHMRFLKERKEIKCVFSPCESAFSQESDIHLRGTDYNLCPRGIKFFTEYLKTFQLAFLLF